LRVDQLQSTSKVLEAVQRVGMLEECIKLAVISSSNSLDNLLKFIGLKESIQLSLESLFVFWALCQNCKVKENSTRWLGPKF
jgi:hypothetical protein